MIISQITHYIHRLASPRCTKDKLTSDDAGHGGSRGSGVLRRPLVSHGHGMFLCVQSYSKLYSPHVLYSTAQLKKQAVEMVN